MRGLITVRTFGLIVVLCIAGACSSSAPDPANDPSPGEATSPADPGGEGQPETVVPTPPIEVKLVGAGADAHRVGFRALKNRDIEVHGKFDEVQGSMTLSPGDLATVTARLEVQLGSVRSGKSRRDENVRTVLFGLHEGAVGLAVIEIVALRPQDRVLAVGEATNAKAELKLTLRGVTSESSVDVRITRVADQRWSVVTAEPAGLSMETMGLGHHVTALKALCMHEDLGDVVAITTELVFSATGS